MFVPVSALFVPSAMQCDDNRSRTRTTAMINTYSVLLCCRGRDVRVNSGKDSFLRTEFQGLWDAVTLTQANTHTHTGYTNAPLVSDRQRQTVGETGCV